jgi:3-oxoacyl-[acyl-carrier-protein] synthase-1
MKGALDNAGMRPSDIDYINLHGTGTQNNDIAEGTAIQILFEQSYPKISSTKSYTGHTLGASGAVEAVYSVLAIRHGIIFPNLRLVTPIKEFPFQPVTACLRDQVVRHVLSNSFGFGELFITHFSAA